MFAEMIESAPSAQAIQSKQYNPGYFFETAAQYAQKRRVTAARTLKNVDVNSVSMIVVLIDVYFYF